MVGSSSLSGITYWRNAADEIEVGRFIDVTPSKNPLKPRRQDGNFSPSEQVDTLRRFQVGKPRRNGRKTRPFACLRRVWRGIRAIYKTSKTAGAASAERQEKQRWQIK